MPYDDVMRILIVEDSPTARVMLAGILRGDGFTDIHEAGSAEEAFAALTGGLEVDLILLDVSLPGMDGITAVRRIGQDQRLAHIPVIMVTAADEARLLQEAFDAGAADFMQKPVSRIELRARVRLALRLKRERDRRKRREAELETLTERLGEINSRLAEMNENLESRVRERTEELVRANAELQSLDAMKTAFLSGVSHEMLTPLTSIKGFATVCQAKLEQMLGDAGGVPPELHPRLGRLLTNARIIVAETERLTARIKDILDLTRMLSGQTVWQEQPYLVEDVCRSAAAAMDQAAAAKGLTLVVELEADLPAMAGDPVRLTQAVKNLLQNAVTFSESGQVSLRANRDRDQVVVSVTDSGSGIPPEELKTIFEPFRQIGDPLTAKPPGIGLGLPLAMRIAAHHGGRLWVSSRPGRGATFSLGLPLSAASRLEPA